MACSSHRACRNVAAARYIERDPTDLRCWRTKYGEPVLRVPAMHFGADGASRQCSSRPRHAHHYGENVRRLRSSMNTVPALALCADRQSAVPIPDRQRSGLGFRILIEVAAYDLPHLPARGGRNFPEVQHRPPLPKLRAASLRYWSRGAPACRNFAHHRPRPVAAPKSPRNIPTYPHEL